MNDELVLERDQKNWKLKLCMYIVYTNILYYELIINYL